MPIAGTQSLNSRLLFNRGGEMFYRPGSRCALKQRRKLMLEALEGRRLLHGNASWMPDSIGTENSYEIESSDVAAANTAFQASDDQLTINHQETAAILPSQFLANDTGVALTVVDVFNPIGGQLVYRDGVAFFTPNDHGHSEHASLSFDYRVADESGEELTATVALVENEMPHGGDETRRDEHLALFRLVDTFDATHVTVASGNWSDPSIWSTGSVPSKLDRALVHHTTEVTYDLASSDSLNWLRVDGMLTFAHDASTQLTVETFISDPRGTINVGTQAQPVQADVQAEILIDSTGGALDQAIDPTLVGRGFISHGRTNLYGSEKSEFTTLRNDAYAGAAFIELSDSQIPFGWQIGDTLLLVGTDVDETLLNSQGIGDQILAADADNARFRDELLSVTDFQVVDGHVRVLFDNITNAESIATGRTSLLWSHARPDGATFDADELAIHVANLTRNVVVRSSDPSVHVQERGHFMVMHNANAEIHHAQFRDLGRTDKRQIVDDPVAVGNFDGSAGNGNNPRGRYGLHLHRLGANDLTGASASVTGNVVWGSPGWGIVHHDSHANLEDNVVFDVVGAGIVAEDGNELGTWRNNLVVKTTGDLVNNFDDGAFFQTLRGPRFDLGFFGSGYWVQGGGFGIRMENNIAASTNAAGFDLVHHTDGLANVEYPSVDLISDPVVRQAFVDAGFQFVTPNNVPTRGVDGLVSYNGFRGIHTWLHNRDSGDMEGTFSFPIYLAHEFRSTIENYTIWGVQSGIQNFYSTRFDFINGLVVGDVAAPVALFIDPVQQGNNTTGLGVGHNHEEANHNRFEGLRLEGFEYGFQVFSPFNEVRGQVTPYATSQLAQSEFANVEHAFISTNAFNPASQQHHFSDLFVLDESSSFTTLDSSNAPPLAEFHSTGAGGLALWLDASGSIDVDGSPQVRSGDDGIVAYAWDFDGDGEYEDAYGQEVLFHPGRAGHHSVGLKVWDDDGAVSTTSQVLDVRQSDLVNPLVDSDFSSNGALQGQFYRFDSGRRNSGWIARDVIRNPAGFVEIGTPSFGRGNLGQVVRDQFVHRGGATFAFDSIAVDALGQANLLRVRLFGVDGQFDLDQQGAPSPIHAMPDPDVATLVDVNIALEQSPSWTNHVFDLDLGTEGFEYLVLAIEYAGYNVAAGDYFALDNFVVASDSDAPRVESFDVNNGEAQRSRVTEINLQFSEPIAGFDANAIVLINTDTGTPFVSMVSHEIVDGRSTATLTFDGPGGTGGSLPDGRYELRILADRATDVAGNPLDGNADGQPGDDHVDSFFRLFGDHDGDGAVGITDFFAFRNAFGPAGVYNAAFDADDDGFISILDFFEFRQRFGTSL